MSIQYTADQLQRKFQGAPGASGFARIAEVLREEGRHEEALALLQEGLKGKPGHLTGHLVLGKCYLDMERLDEAREQFETVLRQDSRCLSAMHHLARIMIKLQWQEAAAAYYRSILELEPWDTETFERYRETNPSGAAGFVAAPAAPAGPMAAPLAPAEVPLDLASAAPAVEEFDLNKVADFLPAESNPSELAGALQEVSLEDGLAAPPAEPRAFAPADAVLDPKPMDVLAEAPVGMPSADAGEAEPPISGDDVGDRLDDLFGADDEPIAKAPAPAADAAPDPDFADATLQLKAMRQEPVPPAGGVTTFSPAPPAPSLTDTNPRGADLSVFAEGELIAPEEQVSGDDIEQRLDDLFSLPDETRTSPVQQAPAVDAPVDAAPAFPEDAATETADFLPASAAATAAEPVDAAEAVEAVPEDAGPEAADLPAAEPPKPALAPFESASLDTILAPEAGIGSGMSPDEVVTGQDVADKLEALFGNEPAARGPKHSEAEPPVSGSASWAAARPMDEVLSPPADSDGPGTAEAPALLSDAETGKTPSDTWVEALETPPPPTSDLMSTESMLPRGMGRDPAPPITGEDIEDRLDSLFNIADDAPPAAPAAELREAAAAEELEAFPAASGPDIAAPVSESAPSAAEPSPSPTPGSLSGGDTDRTMLMPAMKEDAGDWMARQAEEETAPAPEMPRLPETPAAATPGGSDTMIMSNEDVFAPEAAAGMPGGADTVGMEMVDGSDIADRLDQIFAPEDADPRGADLPAAAAKAAADAAIARGEALPEGSPVLRDPEATLPLVEESEPKATDLSVETGEMPLDEVALFAKDPEATLELPESLESPTSETMVSGEDVKTRLSELFDEPDPRNADIEMPAPAYDAAAAEEPAEVFPEPNAWSAGSSTAEAHETSEEMPAAGKPFRPAVPDADGDQPAAEMPPVSPSTVRPAPSLTPMMDEEEGSPEEENAPQSAAGTNVATVTLAEIYFQQGLREQALQIYRQLLEREPGNESVRKRIQEIEASKPEAGPGAGADPRRPRPGLKVPKRKK